MIKCLWKYEKMSFNAISTAMNSAEKTEGVTWTSSFFPFFYFNFPILNHDLHASFFLNFIYLFSFFPTVAHFCTGVK